MGGSARASTNKSVLYIINLIAFLVNILLLLNPSCGGLGRILYSLLIYFIRIY